MFLGQWVVELLKKYHKYFAILHAGGGGGDTRYDTTLNIDAMRCVEVCVYISILR